MNDILLNNAGHGLHGDFHETPIERTVNMIQLNITALTELTCLFGRDMATRGSGHILLVPSLCPGISRRVSMRQLAQR